MTASPSQKTDSPTMRAIRKRLWISIGAVTAFLFALIIGIQLFSRAFPPTFTNALKDLSFTGKEPFLFSAFHTYRNPDNRGYELRDIDGKTYGSGKTVSIISSGDALFMLSAKDDVEGNPVEIFEWNGDAFEKLNIPEENLFLNVYVSVSPDERYLLIQGRNPEVWYVQDRATKIFSENLVDRIPEEMKRTDRDGNWTFLPQLEWKNGEDHTLLIVLQEMNFEVGETEQKGRFVYDPKTDSVEPYTKPLRNAIDPLEDFYIAKGMDSVSLVPIDELCGYMEPVSILTGILPREHHCNTLAVKGYTITVTQPLIGMQKLLVKKGTDGKEQEISSWFSVWGRGFINVQPLGDSGKVIVVINEYVGVLDPETGQFAHVFTMPIRPTMKVTAEGFYGLSLIPRSKE